MAVFGDTLRQARAYKGVTLKEAEQATRINRHHLAALEEENFAVLPPLIYQRGIVRNYAGYLELNPVKLLEAFDEARGADSTPELVAAVKPLEMPNHWAPNFAIIAFLVVMSAIVFAWMYSALFPDGAARGTEIAAVPTVTPVPTNELPQLFIPTPATPNDDAASVPTVVRSLSVSASTAPSAGDTPSIQASNTAVPTVTPADSDDGEVVGGTRESEPEEDRPTPTPAATAPPQEPLQNLAEQADQVVQEDTAVATVVPPVPPANAGPVEQVRVLAQGAGTQVDVVVDNVPMFSGWLGDGQATEYYAGVCFFVTTSDGLATKFENAENPGVPFDLGFVSNSYWLGSC